MATKIQQGLLSDVQLRNWVRAGTPVAKADGSGLTFTLSSAGTAAWVLRYRFATRRKEITLGNYPDLSLAQARKIASALRVQIAAGTDPAAEKQAAKRHAAAAKTVEWVVDDYIAKVLPALGMATQSLYSRQLKRIKKHLGSRLAESIEDSDIVALLQRYQKNGRQEATAFWVVTKQVFKHAKGQRIIRFNPCAEIELTAVLGKREPPRKRLMLTVEEIEHLVNAQMSRANLLSVLILLGTMVRTHELVAARWEHIHMDAQTIEKLGCARWHIPSSKTGPAIDIPLLPPVLAWFQELKSLALDSGYVLPARTYSRLEREGGDAPINHNTIRDAIYYWIDTHSPPVRRFTPHDLRSTGRSYLRALGISRDIAEMCLNHKLQGVEGIYDQYNYWAERRDALSKLAEFLSQHQRPETKATDSRHSVRRLVKH